MDRATAIERKGLEAIHPGELAVDPRVALVRRLQQGAGNASVSRMLSRRATDLADEPSGPTEVEPHGPGEDKDTPGVLADAAREPGEGGIMGLLGAIGSALSSGVAPPAPAPAPAGYIAKSVGNGGVNQPADVKIVADLLRAAGLVVTGDDLGPAIVRYQADVLGWPQQDGRVDPGGKTIAALLAGRRTAPAAAPAPPAPAAAPPAPAVAPPAPVTAAPTTASPVQAASAAPVAAELEAWAAEQPSTNPEWAAWILAAVPRGFVTIKEGTRKQLEQFVAGKTVMAADGAAGAALLGGLGTVGAMIRGRVTRWMADPTQGKQPFFFGDMVRDLQGHRSKTRIAPARPSTSAASTGTGRTARSRSRRRSRICPLVAMASAYVPGPVLSARTESRHAQEASTEGSGRRWLARGYHDAVARVVEDHARNLQVGWGQVGR